MQTHLAGSPRYGYATTAGVVRRCGRSSSVCVRGTHLPITEKYAEEGVQPTDRWTLGWIEYPLRIGAEVKTRILEACDRPGASVARIVAELFLPESQCKFKDVLVRLHADAVEDIDEVGVRVNTLKSTGHQQRLQYGDVFCTELGPTEEPVSPIHGNGSDRTFQVIGVDRQFAMGWTPPLPGKSASERQNGSCESTIQSLRRSPSHYLQSFRCPSRCRSIFDGDDSGCDSGTLRPGTDNNLREDCSRNTKCIGCAHIYPPPCK